MVNWMKAAALKLKRADMSQLSPAQVWTPRGYTGLEDNSVKGCMSQRTESAQVLFCTICWSRFQCFCFDCEKCFTFSMVLDGINVLPPNWLPLDYNI